MHPDQQSVAATEQRLAEEEAAKARDWSWLTPVVALGVVVLGVGAFSLREYFASKPPPPEFIATYVRLFQSIGHQTGGTPPNLLQQLGAESLGVRLIYSVAAGTQVVRVPGGTQASINANVTPNAGFDFVLIDLWKDLYSQCFELLHPKLSQGALVAADNMLFPPTVRPYAKAYQQLVRTKGDMDSLLLPLGSGVELSRKL